MVGTTDTITGATRAGVESLAMWPPQLPVSQWCVFVELGQSRANIYDLIAL